MSWKTAQSGHEASPRLSSAGSQALLLPQHLPLPGVSPAKLSSGAELSSQLCPGGCDFFLIVYLIKSGFVKDSQSLTERLHSLAHLDANSELRCAGLERP